MTDETPDREFDLAVSFAGEHRSYVEAVVRGLGADDLNVFYDNDNKAEMFGEDLVEYFTDLYQNRARYVAMFVSEPYREKMWTTVERRSALAEAARRRTAYILPIRMDDTDLPGLLPTVGYLDSRYEGLDGVISILREKLGGERVSASYDGRVPETQADIDLLLALRPDYWEYWLYAGVMRIRLAALEEKYRDYEMGFAPQTGEQHLDWDGFEFLKAVPNQAINLVENFNAVFRSDVQERAFGAPGEPGDAERIIHLAGRLVDVYEGFLDEASRIRGAALSDEFREAQRAAAEFGSEAVEQVRQFVAECVESMNSLPELVAAHDDDDEPLQLSMTLTLTVSDDLVDRFTRSVEDGVNALRSKE